MELRIIVTEQAYHPYLDLPPQTTIKEFKMEEGKAAEIHYTKLKAQAIKSGGMMGVNISIVTKM